MLKKLTYAYASSPHSIKYNNHKGCWLIFIDNQLAATFQDSERWKALEYFESIALPHNTIESFTRESLPFREIQSV